MEQEDLKPDIYEEIIEEELFTKVKIEPYSLLSGGNTFSEEFMDTDFDDLKDTMAKIDPSLMEHMNVKSEEPVCRKDFETKNKVQDSLIETKDEFKTTLEFFDNAIEEDTESSLDEDEIVQEDEKFEFVPENEKFVQKDESVWSERNENVSYYKCKTCGKTFTRSVALKSHELMHSLDEDSLSEEVDCGSSTSNSEDELYLDGNSSDNCAQRVDRKKSVKQRTGKIHKKFHIMSVLQNSQDDELSKCGSTFVNNVINKESSESNSHNAEKSGEKEGTPTSNKRSEKEIKKNLPPVKCSICGKTFTTKSHLNIHVKNIHKYMAERCKCSECGKYITKKHFKQHIQDVHLKIGPKRTNGLKKCSCDICGQVRYGKCAMREHMNMHTGEKPHKCKQCENCYPSRSSLFYHVTTKHTTKSPVRKLVDPALLTCAICGKIFTLESTLKKHIRVHVGDRVLTCVKCGKYFVDQSKLKRHLNAKRSCDKVKSK